MNKENVRQVFKKLSEIKASQGAQYNLCVKAEFFKLFTIKSTVQNTFYQTISLVCVHTDFFLFRSVLFHL